MAPSSMSLKTTERTYKSEIKTNGGINSDSQRVFDSKQKTNDDCVDNDTESKYN